MNADPTDGGLAASQRLDLWLWFARFYKTRALAQAMCSKSRVRVNRTPVGKPAHAVRIGDVLTLPQGNAIRVVRVLGFAERRGSAPEAQALYEDLDEA